MTAIAEIWGHSVSRVGATCTVTLSGELDMSICDDLVHVLVDEVHRPGVSCVQADLDGVHFIDSSAINALIGAYRCARSSGRRFTVTRAHDHVRRVLDVTGVLPTLSA